MHRINDSDLWNMYRSTAPPGETEWLAQITKRCTENTVTSSPPEGLAGDARCIGLTLDGAGVKYRLWHYLSGTLGWPVASPRCVG